MQDDASALDARRSRVVDRALRVASVLFVVLMPGHLFNMWVAGTLPDATPLILASVCNAWLLARTAVLHFRRTLRPVRIAVVDAAICCGAVSWSVALSTTGVPVHSFLPAMSIAIAIAAFVTLVPLPPPVSLVTLPVSALALPVTRLLFSGDSPSHPSFVISQSLMATTLILALLAQRVHDRFFERQARTLRQLELTAETDALTQSLNRRAFVDRFVRELSRAERTNRPVSLLILDIDRFKRFNSDHGYAAGDRMLRAFAARIRETMIEVDAPPGSCLARYGGEEFVVLLPGVRASSVRAIAERVRESIAAVEVPWQRGVLRVTTSLGFGTIFPTGNAAGQGFFARVDAALYEAKRRGGNCCVSEDELELAQSFHARFVADQAEPEDRMDEESETVIEGIRKLHGTGLRVLSWASMVIVTLFTLAEWAAVQLQFDAPFHIGFEHRASLAAAFALYPLLHRVIDPDGRRAWIWHAALVLIVSALTLPSLSPSGGTESPWLIRIIAMILTWAFAISAPLNASIAVPALVVVGFELWFVVGGMSAADSRLAMGVAVLASSALVAILAQRSLRRLLAGEIASAAELQRASRIDSLTGLSNRAAFEAAMREEIQRVGTRGGLSIAIFDLDHFKTLNDTLGHLAGDRALVAIGRIVRQSARATDLLFRIGGEEFVLLMPETSLRDALAVTERMRAAVEAADIPEVGRLTASFGVVEWRQGETDAVLLARADRAMRTAKQEGRNLVRGGATPLHAPGSVSSPGIDVSGAVLLHPDRASGQHPIVGRSGG